jgi:putative phage-type endonuclease
MEWIDRGLYWEHKAKQGTQEWKNARIGRINSSNSGGMVGNSNFKNKNPEQIGKYIAGIEEEIFEQKSLDAMHYGTKMEPFARNWYEKNYNCKVIERGLCVDKNDFRIGASIDGEVENSSIIIEIKCPKKMYNPLKLYMQNISHGWKPPSNYYDHIWESHFSQMQQGMHVLKKEFCDYIVYCPEEQKIFTQRIPFDLSYWNNHYSILIKNYDLYILPYLIKNYPICPF